MAGTNERLQQAIAAARAGNTEEARELVDSLVAENPENPHALFLRGMLAGSEEEQLEYLYRVLEIDPDHKAANRRMAQIAPPPKDDATVLIVDEAEEIEELEADEEYPADKTVVGAGALFAAEDDLEDETGEWGVTETVVTAAAVGVGIEAFDDDSTMIDPGKYEDTALEEDITEEAAADDGLDEAILSAAAATGVVMASDQDEDVPDWLMAEIRPEEDLPEINSQDDFWQETPVETGDELPDWLTEEPSDNWSDPGAEDVTVFAAATADESDLGDSWSTEYEDQQAPFDQATPAEGEVSGADLATEDEVSQEASDKKPKKKSSTRGLEVALVILIVVALLIVIGLLYILIYPPF